MSGSGEAGDDFIANFYSSQHLLPPEMCSTFAGRSGTVTINGSDVTFVLRGLRGRGSKGHSDWGRTEGQFSEPFLATFKTYNVKFRMKLNDKFADIFIYSARLNYRNYIYDSGSVRAIIQAAEKERLLSEGPPSGSEASS